MRNLKLDFDPSLTHFLVRTERKKKKKSKTPKFEAPNGTLNYTTSITYLVSVACDLPR